jgi:hypothetical protein
MAEIKNLKDIQNYDYSLEKIFHDAEDFLPLLGTDYVELYVGNAKQSAHYYKTAFGFQSEAYAGLETGMKDRVSYVLKQDKIRLVLTTPLQEDGELNAHINKHGDGVKVVALWVEDATKAFEEHFTLSLAAELAPDRIDCICLRPGITVSRMSGIKDPSFFCPSAKDMAHSIINQISSAGNDVSVVPYFPHSILDYINSFVPQQISWGIVREMHNVKRKLLLEQKTD